MRLFIRAPFFLITSSLFLILYFATSAAAQSPENRKLSPQEIKELGYDTGNPPGPYYKTSPDRVFELNGADGPQPPNGPGYAGVGCDSRQNPIIYSSPTADPSKFKSWESGSCMENGKPCCVNIDRAGYPIKIGDPGYVITDSQRQQCSEPPDSPDARFRDQRVCDLIEQESSTPQPGNPTQQQTFESYQPPEIACQAPGAWAAVDRNGKGIQQNGRVQFIVCTCDVCGPGAASKFNNIPDRDPNSYRHVFANPGNPDTGNVVGLSGDDATYSFKTGLWTTSAGQFRDGIPMSGSGSSPVIVPPTGPGDSPAQAELARATAARQEAEQQLNNAQTALASATATQQAAEQQLATAKITLASATEALQAAEQALQQAAEQQAAELAIAERAVQDAEQQSTSVDMELETAARSLVLLEQQRDNAKELVAKLEVRRDDALRILNEARARVAKITGGVGDIQDSATDTGTGPGSLPSGDLVASNNDWDCFMKGPDTRGPGTRIRIIKGIHHNDSTAVASKKESREACLRLESHSKSVLEECTSNSLCLVAFFNRPDDLIEGDFAIISDGVRLGESAILDPSPFAGVDILNSIRRHLDYDDLPIVASNNKSNTNPGYVHIKRWGGINGVATVDGSSQLFNSINILSQAEVDSLFEREGGSPDAEGGQIGGPVVNPNVSASPPSNEPKGVPLPVDGFQTITPFTGGVGRLLDTSGLRSPGKTRNHCANGGNMANAVDGDPETIWQCPKQIAISFRATKGEVAVFRAASMRGYHGYGGTVDVYVSASGGTGSEGFEMQDQPDKYTFVGQIIFDPFGFTRTEFEPIEGKSIHFLFNEVTEDGKGKMPKREMRPTISEVTIEAGVSPKGFMGEGGDYGYANGSRRTVR